MAATIALPLRIGARTLWRIERRLLRVPVSLEQGRAGALPCLPRLEGDADGYLVTALAEELLPSLRADHPRLAPFIRQRYRRSYAALDQSFETYFSSFSAKSRSTLKRKRRKLAERSGGTLDIRCYARADEMAAFMAEAGAVSRASYQERLLDAGLPQGREALARMEHLAARDQLRAWVLFLDGAPISYLYAPAEGGTLIYSHLGYDPDHAQWSPGTILQLEAMRQLMKERRFALFDFTEGDGQHKRLFATGGIDCVDLLLMRRKPGNLAAGHFLNGFDSAVSLGKAMVARLGAERLARILRR